MPLHEGLGEVLRAFELRRRLRRAEDAQAARAEHVDDAGGQRRLGADDGERDLLLLREVGAAPSRSVIGDVLAARGSSAVPALPGATKTVCTRRRLRQLPGQRVLAAAAADDEDFHGAAHSISSAL